jgi:uncharacterized cupredoxin-like copper-binding protein
VRTGSGANAIIRLVRINGPGLAAVAIAVALAAGGCESGAPPATPPITPGLPTEPRDVNVIARDFSFEPPVVDLVPGETVRIHLVNGGLDVHEAVLGGPDVQDAWEAAEAATVGHPPGPTPAVSVPPGLDGLRIVVESGERADVEWTVPLDAADEPGAWAIGCHIPGHLEAGMIVPVRWVRPGGESLATRPARSDGAMPPPR